MVDSISPRTLFDLIAVLNTSFADYDFSDSKSGDFSLVASYDVSIFRRTSRNKWLDFSESYEGLLCSECATKSGWEVGQRRLWLLSTEKWSLVDNQEWDQTGGVHHVHVSLSSIGLWKMIVFLQIQGWLLSWSLHCQRLVTQLLSVQQESEASSVHLVQVSSLLSLSLLSTVTLSELSGRST